jgi:hypothetical protein
VSRRSGQGMLYKKKILLTYICLFKLSMMMRQTTDLERKDVRKVGWNDATCRSGPRGYVLLFMLLFFLFY